jgi:hypothetical protein
VPRQAPVMPSPVAAVVIPEVQITAVPQKFVAEEPIRRLTPPAPKKAVEAPEVIDLSQDRVIPRTVHRRGVSQARRAHRGCG